MSSLINNLDQQEFIKTWSGKFDTLAGMVNVTREGIASIVAAITQNFGAIQANLSVNSDAIEQLDIYNQIWAKMFVSLFEQLEMATLDPDWKNKAKDRFSAIFQECKDRVIEEREAYIKECRSKMDAERKAQTQDQVAEDTLRNAEQSMGVPGGSGSAIPEGAEIFGG